MHCAENAGFDLGEHDIEINLDEHLDDEEKHKKTPIAQALSMQYANFRFILFHTRGMLIISGSHKR